MISKLDAREFQERLQALDALLREAEELADPVSKARLQKIMQAVLHIHGKGLGRVIAYLAEAGEAGQGILDACSRDEIVSGLLLLHGLHPLSVSERVQQALDNVQPILRSHGGKVELVTISDGVVRLRLQGSCHDCPSSAVTMQQTIEEAIYAKAPEVTLVEVEESLETLLLNHEVNRITLPLV